MPPKKFKPSRENSLKSFDSFSIKENFAGLAPVGFYSRRDLDQAHESLEIVRTEAAIDFQLSERRVAQSELIAIVAIESLDHLGKRSGFKIKNFRFQDRISSISVSDLTLTLGAGSEFSKGRTTCWLAVR